VLKVDPERGHDLVAASNEDLARLKQQGEGWADTDLLRLMRLAAECQWPMRDSPQPLVHLEAAVLQMATLEPAESVAALIERLESLERKLAGGGAGSSASGTAAGRGAAAPVTARTHGFAAPAAATPPAPPAAPAVTPAPGFTPPRASEGAPPAPRVSPPLVTSVSATTSTKLETTEATATTTAIVEEAELDEAIQSSWHATITAVSGRKRMLGAFLAETRLVGVAGGTLVLAMDDLHRSVVDATEHRALVQEELSRAFGRALRLSCTPSADNTPERRAAKADSLKPIIDRAMEVFDGEVIERGERGERGERPDRAGHGGERTS
jgi:DNA polymerase-3 subunit gamma/tau